MEPQPEPIDMDSETLGLIKARDKARDKARAMLKRSPMGRHLQSGVAWARHPGCINDETEHDCNKRIKTNFYKVIIDGITIRDRPVNDSGISREKLNAGDIVYIDRFVDQGDLRFGHIRYLKGVGQKLLKYNGWIKQSTEGMGSKVGRALEWGQGAIQDFVGQGAIQDFVDDAADRAAAAAVQRAPPRLVLENFPGEYWNTEEGAELMREYKTLVEINITMEMIKVSKQMFPPSGGGKGKRKSKRKKTQKRKKRINKSNRRKTTKRKNRNQRGGDTLEYFSPGRGWISGSIDYNGDGSITVNGKNIKCGNYYEHGNGWAFEQPGGGEIVYIRPSDPSNMTDLLTNWGC